MNFAVTELADNCEFLSRLCGGERYQNLKELLPKFLSRLCGGEHTVLWEVVTNFFLSRLCGGEQKS